MLGSTNVRVGSEIFGARQYKSTGDGPAQSNDAPGQSPSGPAGDSEEQAAPPCGHSGDPGGHQSADPVRLSAVQ